jgi:hypothetical protein
MRLAWYGCATSSALLAVSIYSSFGCEPPALDDPSYSSSGAPKRNKSTPAPSEEGEDDGSSTPKKKRPSPGGSPSPDADGGISTQLDGGGGVITGGKAECAPNTTAATCYRCCETAHPQGILFFDQSFQTCACGTGAGSCSAECGTNFCTGTQATPVNPTPACEACLNASDACRTATDAACAKNTSCMAMLACDQSSACATKP